MDASDQGHRYGNFPNYYSFHPPRNRLRVLEGSNILSYIRNNSLLLVPPLSSSTGRTDDEEHSARGKRPRMEEEPQSTSSSSRGSGDGDDHRGDDICYYYCDLGCNEGDLTVAMASSLLLSNDAAAAAAATAADGTGDHRASSNAANDGTPTTPAGGNGSLATATTKTTTTIKCLGLDLDPMLIQRANTKFCSDTNSAAAAAAAAPQSQDDDDGIVGSNNKSSNNEAAAAAAVKPTFKACNLTSAAEHNDAIRSFFRNRETALEEEGLNEDNNAIIAPLFHLTTIFSTTMWIHVHSGDVGLGEFLKRACGWTREFLLIEPQPSGCYRKANLRLRKMARPELDDVSSSRLKMRPDVEAEIERVVTGCGFRRVALEEMEMVHGNEKQKQRENNKENGDGQQREERKKLTAAAAAGDGNGNEGKKKRGAVTAWKRSLHLYKRVV